MPKLLLVFSLLSAVCLGQVTANFAASGPGNVVPGIGQVGSILKDATTITNLHNAGFQESRFSANMGSVQGGIYDPAQCTTPPCYNVIDPNVSKARNGGFTVLAMVVKIPSADYPSPNNCAVPGNAAPPRDKLTDYGNKVAALAHHMDVTYPGTVIDYEVWNEPDINSGLCVSNTGDPNQYASVQEAYQQIFHAVAAAIHAQAATDGVTLNVGGPVLGKWQNAKCVLADHSDCWISGDSIKSLLTGIAKADVDFLSYHQYASGTNALATFYNASDPINCPFTGTGACSLWTRTQGTAANQNSPTGYAYVYNLFYTTMKAGSQTNKAIPLYISEYNDDAAFIQDSWRNAYPYGQLFNAAVIADILGGQWSAYDDWDQTKLFFFSSQFDNSPSTNYFCVYGTINTNMDCTPLALTAYPNFYLFKMIYGSGYMGLSAGTNSYSSNYNAFTGLLTAAWTTVGSGNYPRYADVLLINPTTAAINTTVELDVLEPYVNVAPVGWKYSLTATSVNLSGMTWTNLGGLYNTDWISSSITVPAQSVVGVQLTQ